MITLIQYGGEKIFESQINTFEDLIARFDPSMTNWINVDGFYDVEILRRIRRTFQYHPLALEDVLNRTQRPKVENYADHFPTVASVAMGMMIFFKRKKWL
jgi:magnesium transporter